jgi:hypothetical protein
MEQAYRLRLRISDLGFLLAALPRRRSGSVFGFRPSDLRRIPAQIIPGATQVLALV